ncbi:hypothetical protein D9756_000519 [Leucocoprinus leucothites]|uniref:Uncharacterized protein n=1 Tax=Leucocoprinus leucothites TaxID=201217 RepID=A0A8H5GFT0_9AGAR|nr:hypothetical protein D9756_000519 [Leucoagaricus leucothites]
MAALVQRQLPNLLSGLLPLPHHTETADSTRSAGLATSETITLTDPISLTPTVTSLSQTSTTATLSISESSVTPSSATPSSTSGTPTVTPTLTSVPVETTSASDSTFFVTVTSQSPSPTPSVQAAPANSNNGFLQNKTLSGIVFAVIGVVALVVIVAITTIALRRSKRKRLHSEAMTFDPPFPGGNQLDRDSNEKRRFSLLSSDNGHSGRGGGLGEYSTAATPAYTRQDAYRFPASESQHTLIAQSQQPWYGGAPNGSYGATHAPQSNAHPAWMYGNDVAPVLPPIPSDRNRSPESDTYLQPSNLKIANA